ncbi:2-isopropylmalate synthase [Anaerolineales bacterium HSG25]|nr:2-isopropylmalate synthase [Anaerolineales bacterium HSG25]
MTQIVTDEQHDVVAQPSVSQPNGNGKPMLKKYQPFPQIDLSNRQWPTRTITTAPIWCSVDLRDGNQALAIPMSVDEKIAMFQLLVDIGFKEIEVGFPAASQIEFDFLRRLVDENLIPDDVRVQVLVQAREHLIRRTFDSLQGTKKAILHLYNSTSPVQREVVFGMSKQEIIDIAVSATKLVKSLAPTLPDTDLMFQYSPESFSATELSFAVEVCDAVADTWQPTPERKMILNLPATVELATPNVHADQIEWFCQNIHKRDSVIISLHTHNDRGTGIAATELGLLAGAERVEGTLFGNGERTGNVDLVTVALNMYTQGVDPHLNFDDINGVRLAYEQGTRMLVHSRHPYAGDLVFTAFSGSHQDAINKGMAVQNKKTDPLWDVPYLPIDPQDIGRNYEAIIRINAQSGKGGVAYLLEHEFGFKLPKAMRIEFGKIINDMADKLGNEISSLQIRESFEQTYLHITSPFKLEKFRTQLLNNDDPDKSVRCEADLLIDGKPHTVQGYGNGPINAFMQAMKEELVPEFRLLSYSEHSLQKGSGAEAVSYIQICTPSNESFFGAGTDTNIELASIKALVSALNRALSN